MGRNKLRIDIKKIVVHYCPDLDVFMALALIFLFGDRYFTLLDDTPVQFVPAGELPQSLVEDCLGKAFIESLLQELAAENLPQKQFQDEWNRRVGAAMLKAGVLVIDTGFGLFDHHQSQDKKCATDLVAEYIEVDQNPWLMPVLDFVRGQDLKGENIPFKNGEEIILLTSIIRGLHISYEACNELEHLETCFWFLTKVLEAVIMTAKNCEDFSADISALHLLKTDKREDSSDIKSGGRIFFLEDAYRQYNEACGKGDTKLSRFMAEHGCFSGAPAQAMFTLYGVFYGLPLVMSEEAAAKFLTAIFLALDKYDEDGKLAVADWQSLYTARVVRFKSQDNKTVTMCGISSPAYSAGKAARYALGNAYHKSQLVFCFRPNGQTQITCPDNIWWRRRLYFAGVTLRMAELIKRDEQFVPADVDMIRDCLKVPEWYVDTIITNGSWINPEAPRTALNRAQIMRLVQSVFYSGQYLPKQTIDKILAAGANEAWPEGIYPTNWKDIRDIQ